MMSDDIARNPLNPRPGVIINHPNGSDVYAGVPKDYTGKQVTAQNFYAVLLGDKKAVKGGSGKVIDSKPDDRIFIYYSDHGGPGVLGMPNKPFIYAGDFMNVLKKKHAARGYKEMIIYVEACESGSMFQGIMPSDLNIYVTTASDAKENSWGAYCPDMDPPIPPEYLTCLGDLYSIAWMEHSETHNLREETVETQYQAVKARTANHNKFDRGSHVMEFGDKSVKPEKLCLYQGFDPSNVGVAQNRLGMTMNMDVVNQRDADIHFLWKRYEGLKDGSEEKNEIFKEINETLTHRTHVDKSIDSIGKLIFGPKMGPFILKSVRPSMMPLVDDWDCLKSMVRVFETHCGSLTQYGMKHMRAFANICNKGITLKRMEEVCSRICMSCNSLSLGEFSA